MRVLHVGLGPVGRRIATDLAERRMGESIGAIDPSMDLVGRPLAEIVSVASTDTTVLPDLDHFRRWNDVDAVVVATSSDLSVCAPTLRALLDRGLTVVSTCEELVWPWLRHADLARELDGLFRRRGGRILGTGVNPGFLMDTLAIACSAVCREVRAVRVWRIQDASDRRVPFQRKIGTGLAPEEFRRRAESGAIRHVGLGESLHLIAARLGLEVVDWDESLEPVIAARDASSAFGPVSAGSIAGVLQVARARANGTTTIELRFLAAVGQPDPHDRIRIEGDPTVDLRIEGGVHGDVATAAIALNALGSLRDAQPGLHTMASIPVVHFRRG